MIARPCVPLARPGVGFSPLSADGQFPFVAHSPVAADVDQPLDVHRHFFPEIAFDLLLFLDSLPDLVHFIFGKGLDLLVLVDLDPFKNLYGLGSPDAVNVGQADFDPLFRGKSDTCNSCHFDLFLSLFLFVSRIRADDSNVPFPLDDLAVSADLFNRRSDFHDIHPLLESIGYPSLGQVVRRKLDQDPVSREDADEVFPHLPRYVGQNDVFVGQLNPEHGVGQSLHDNTFGLEHILLRHSDTPWRILPAGSSHALKISTPSAVMATVCS